MPIPYEEKYWKLYERACEILEGRANGYALPIIRKLAARDFPPAVTVLSDYVADGEALKILNRSARQREAASAYNLAITHRNRGDMYNYRRALSYAAKLDPEAAEELRRFKLRFPEAVMRKFGRLAPDRT